MHYISHAKFTDEVDIPFEANMQTKRCGQQQIKRMKESEVVGYLPRFQIFRQVKYFAKKILAFLRQMKTFQHENKVNYGISEECN